MAASFTHEEIDARDLDFARVSGHMCAMAKATRSRTNRSQKTERVEIDDSRVEIIAPGRFAPVELRALATTAAIGLGGGWLASVIVGGSGLLRYTITGVLGGLLGGAIVRYSGWRITVGHVLADRLIVAALGAVIVVLLARFIA
jgi:uncharacterized membrane protein YeaQ/YmgE (transglycosylase-associated protein family)